MSLRSKLPSGIPRAPARLLAATLVTIGGPWAATGFGLLFGFDDEPGAFTLFLLAVAAASYVGGFVFAALATAISIPLIGYFKLFLSGFFNEPSQCRTQLT